MLVVILGDQEGIARSLSAGACCGADIQALLGLLESDVGRNGLAGRGHRGPRAWPAGVEVARG